MDTKEAIIYLLISFGIICLIALLDAEKENKMAQVTVEQKSAISKIKKIDLALSESEARWLKAVLQNPIGGVEPEEEATEDHLFRAEIWTALNGAVPR